MEIKVTIIDGRQRDEGIIERLDYVISLLGQSRTRERTMAADLSALQAQVAANTTVVQSVVVLIDGLAAKIEAAKNDPVAIQQLVDTLRADEQTLASKVVEHTPAA